MGGLDWLVLDFAEQYLGRYRKSYMGFRLEQKLMTLSDLEDCCKLNVID